MTRVLKHINFGAKALEIADRHMKAEGVSNFTKWINDLVEMRDIKTVCCTKDCGAHIHGSPHASLISHGYCAQCYADQINDPEFRALVDANKKKMEQQIAIETGEGSPADG